MFKERKEAIGLALLHFEQVGKVGDCKDCAGCKLRVCVTPSRGGATRKRILEECKGFDEKGEPISNSNCVLVNALTAKVKRSRNEGHNGFFWS